VIPNIDGIAEFLAVGGVDVGEWRAPRDERDGGVREQTGLSADRWDIPSPKQLQDHGEDRDLARRDEARADSNEGDSEHRRDQRARLGAWDVLPPEPVRCDLAGCPDGESDRQHLQGRNLEDDEARDHRRCQCDSGDQVIRQRGRFECGAIQCGRRSSQHAGIVGKRES
jgi:hypothetical protein